MYFIAPLSKPPNYGGAGRGAELPSAAVFVEADSGATDLFSAAALQNNNRVFN